MQNSKAQEIREKWGEEQYSHPFLEKEYYLGANTLDFICSVCGQEFTKEEKEKIERGRNSSPK
jgi:hypothetical protein